MRQPSELSYLDLQQIVESIQRFLYIDQDDAGREIWDPDKEWSGADVCEHLAHMLSLHQLVPEASRPVAGRPHPYGLDPIDGPAFRKQRQLLLSLATLAREGETYRASSADQDLLDGLVNLTDVIADQAHDKHGVDCLLEPGITCDCQKPGYFCSGVPGIVAHVENGQLSSGSKVESCDQCQRYPSDQAARDKLVELGIV
jgi:hypothetical protein